MRFDSGFGVVPSSPATPRAASATRRSRTVRWRLPLPPSLPTSADPDACPVIGTALPAATTRYPPCASLPLCFPAHVPPSLPRHTLRPTYLPTYLRWLFLVVVIGLTVGTALLIRSSNPSMGCASRLVVCRRSWCSRADVCCCYCRVFPQYARNTNCRKCRTPKPEVAAVDAAAAPVASE